MTCGPGCGSVVWFRVWFGVNAVSAIKNVLIGVKKSERRKDFTYMTVETFQFITDYNGFLEKCRRIFSILEKVL